MQHTRNRLEDAMEQKTGSELVTPATAPRIAGLVQPRCSCCPAKHTLVAHESLGPTRRFCPASGTVYLDRGDGRYLPDGEAIDPAVRESASTPEIVSDRPVRTDDKTRIELERATFA
jgi:hypothetical protein